MHRGLFKANAEDLQAVEYITGQAIWAAFIKNHFANLPTQEPENPSVSKPQPQMGQPEPQMGVSPTIRLQKLKTLRDKDLISSGEAKTKRQKILDEI